MSWIRSLALAIRKTKQKFASQAIILFYFRVMQHKDVSVIVINL